MGPNLIRAHPPCASASSLFLPLLRCCVRVPLCHIRLFQCFLGHFHPLVYHVPTVAAAAATSTSVCLPESCVCVPCSFVLRYVPFTPCRGPVPTAVLPLCCSCTCLIACLPLVVSRSASRFLLSSPHPCPRHPSMRMYTSYHTPYNTTQHITSHAPHHIQCLGPPVPPRVFLPPVLTLSSCAHSARCVSPTTHPSVLSRPPFSRFPCVSVGPPCHSHNHTPFASSFLPSFLFLGKPLGLPPRVSVSLHPSSPFRLWLWRTLGVWFGSLVLSSSFPSPSPSSPRFCGLLVCPSFLILSLSLLFFSLLLLFVFSSSSLLEPGFHSGSFLFPPSAFHLPPEILDALPAPADRGLWIADRCFPSVSVSLLHSPFFLQVHPLPPVPAAHRDSNRSIDVYHHLCQEPPTHNTTYICTLQTTLVALVASSLCD